MTKAGRKGLITLLHLTIDLFDIAFENHPRNGLKGDFKTPAAIGAW
jgi:hypothetical protein